MPRVVHIIGNGDNASLYHREPRKGLKLACNQTPFPIKDKYATVMVDFKFMNAMMKGTVIVDGQWICGFRPKKWMDDHPEWYMKVAHQVKEFYTELNFYKDREEYLNLPWEVEAYRVQEELLDEWKSRRNRT